MIECKNVTVIRSGTTILKEWNFSVPKGGLTIILGPSGSGKTTICELFSGNLRPDVGQVTVADAEVRRGKLIGIVSQSLPLLDDRSVSENVILPLELQSMKMSRGHERLEEVLERFDLTAIRDKRPVAISMSERGRALIARAVITEPFLLIADEPTAHLDSNASADIARHLQREHLRGMTMLIATSDERFASRFPAAPVENIASMNKVNNY